MSKFKLKTSLLATTVIAGFAVASPAFAQTAPPPPGDTTSQDANSQAQTQSQTPDATPPSTAAQPSGGEIVVTGTITRNPAAATASPVVSVTADDIQQRGIAARFQRRLHARAVRRHAFGRLSAGGRYAA